VRGFVRDANGIYITLDHPATLQPFGFPVNETLVYGIYNAVTIVGGSVAKSVLLAVGAGLCTRAEQTLPTAFEADQQELSD
jgi:hypothetical protein